jgi:hypothetical protein
VRVKLPVMLTSQYKSLVVRGGMHWGHTVAWSISTSFDRRSNLQWLSCARGIPTAAVFLYGLGPRHYGNSGGSIVGVTVFGPGAARIKRWMRTRGGNREHEGELDTVDSIARRHHHLERLITIPGIRTLTVALQICGAG